MQYRTFGRTGLKLSTLGFGCGSVGGLIGRGHARFQKRRWASHLSAWRPPSSLMTRSDLLNEAPCPSKGLSEWRNLQARFQARSARDCGPLRPSLASKLHQIRK